MQKAALFTAGILFLVVSVMHLLRLFYNVEVKIKNFVVPLWASIVGFIVSLGLAIWMFRVCTP